MAARSRGGDQTDREGGIMSVIKFPYDASRRIHSRKPRRSKNGTPEERAARAAAEGATRMPAEVVDLRARPADDASSTVDRRKLRGSPLRDKVAPISFAVTIVGKMFTANLRGELLDLEAAASEGWLESLQAGANAARFVADELEKAAQRLTRDKSESEFSDFQVNLPVHDVGQSVLNSPEDN
jgi:hypothetical protein